ncbi:MAG: DUF4340 domain-containing protein [Candidatus Latescibacterota bacterium]|nr:MAG: DUF4340 domain-containing protein [Candidatus Latescibacterota bacterium]
MPKYINVVPKVGETVKIAVFDYRNKKVIELSVGDVSRLNIVSNGRSVVWTRDDTGRWITSLLGDTIRGDKTSVENIIRELRGLRAKDIPLGEATGERYFPKIAGTISLGMEPDQPEIMLTFSDEDSEGCYVKKSGSERIALIEPTVLHVFDKTYDDLRDRRLLDFEPETAARITLETTGATLSIIKTDADWSFSNPEFGSIDVGTAEALLTRIEGLRFSRAIEEQLRDPKGYGFAKPAYRVVIYDSDNRKIDELIAGHPLPSFEQSYVTSLSTGMLAGIETRLLSDLLDDFQNLATK